MFETTKIQVLMCFHFDTLHICWISSFLLFCFWFIYDYSYQQCDIFILGNWRKIPTWNIKPTRFFFWHSIIIDLRNTQLKIRKKEKVVFLFTYNSFSLFNFARILFFSLSLSFSFCHAKDCFFFLLVSLSVLISSKMKIPNISHSYRLLFTRDVFLRFWMNINKLLIFKSFAYFKLILSDKFLFHSLTISSHGFLCMMTVML